MTVNYRIARSTDIAACIELRGKTRDNSISVQRLRELGVTHETWSGGVANGSVFGHVCLHDDVIVGFCFGEKSTGEVLVLAVSPEWDGRGVGKALLDIVVREFAKLGFQRVFLGCSANQELRSYGFYRHLGWKSTGTFSGRDEILEYFL